MRHTALSYLQQGLSVLPAIRQAKRPCIGSWKQYQMRLPTQAEVDAWFSNAQNALCIIAGKVSGNLEIIDFDNGGELFDAWHKHIPATLANSLVIEQSPSGGWHVIYRCQSEISGNMKLAERKIGEKTQTLIETRGEGGLFLCAPTAGYELMQGDLTSIPILTQDQRELLLEAAWELNEHIPEPAPIPAYSAPSSQCLRPGDDYNVRGDVEALLRNHGWQYVGADDVNQKWRRPGKTWGHSACLRHQDKVFYAFSSNCQPFKHQTAYRPFSIYALLEHGGDYSKAAVELAKQGYGEKQDPNLSGILSASEHLDDDEPVSLTQLITNFRGLNPPVIHGLLRQGETMNIIASPKVGKSWLVNLLSISLATGLNWLDFTVEPGRVLLIDNELHSNTTTYRLMQVAEALNLRHHQFSDQIRVKSLRGKLTDLHGLANTFQKIEPYQYKVIVIDAFYRTLPAGVDENDNGAIANLYNLLDLHASRLHCAFILIHHASKGNQANKSVTDVGAGAGSQSRAVDTHLIIRPHDQPDTFVIDAAVRSWAPIEPLVIRKQHPLFIVDRSLDPGALLGAEQKRESPKEPSLQEFVDHCVGKCDPCILNTIAHEARQQFGMTDYRVKALVESALDQQLILRLKVGSKMKYVKVRPGFNGDKWQLAAAIIEHNPAMTMAEICQISGASERYIRMLKSGNETEMEKFVSESFPP